MVRSILIIQLALSKCSVVFFRIGASRLFFKVAKPLLSEHNPLYNQAKMSKTVRSDEILNINVSGKKFNVRRSVLIADPKSKLSDWFKQNSTKSVPQDKSGNYFLDVDGRSFRYIVNYLRYLHEKVPVDFALPLKADELTTLMAEAELLKLEQLSDLCSEMLLRYQREDAALTESVFVGVINKTSEMWNKREEKKLTRKSKIDTDDW